MVFVSVILPNFNHAPYLKQRIDSILRQTYQHYEVIIIDDGSTDHSREILNRYAGHPKIKAINCNTENMGSPFKLWEPGIALAKGDWIWIAESDDIALPEFLTKMVAVAEKTKPGIVYCDSYILVNNERKDHTFSSMKNRFFQVSKWSADYCMEGVAELNGSLKFINNINNVSAMIFRKAYADQYLDELKNFRFFGDWYFVINMCLSHNICYINLPLNYYRDHAASHSNLTPVSLQKKMEHFSILRLLYYSEKITRKKELIRHFAMAYLNAGLLSTGFPFFLQLIKGYIKADRKLGWKVAKQIMYGKMKREKYKGWYEY